MVSFRLEVAVHSSGSTPGKAFAVGKHKTLAACKVEKDTSLGSSPQLHPGRQIPPLRKDRRSYLPEVGGPILISGSAQGGGDTSGPAVRCRFCAGLPFLSRFVSR
jgi:hypothetical protein